MSETLKSLTLDVATGEVTEKELDADEIALVEALKSEYDARLLQEQAKEKAKLSALAKLKKLGLTAAEIEAL